MTIGPEPITSTFSGLLGMIVPLSAVLCGPGPCEARDEFLPMLYPVSALWL